MLCIVIVLSEVDSHLNRTVKNGIKGVSREKNVSDRFIATKS